MKKLTVEILKAHGACNEGLETFKRIFPRGTYCSKKDIEKWLVLDYKYAVKNVAWAYAVIINNGSLPGVADNVICAFAKAWRRHA